MDNKEAIAAEGANEQQPDRALALIGTMAVCSSSDIWVRPR
jgi:hypothetical protein